MKALDLYKKLPRANCGRCSLKACMPFAISVIKGDTDISECPLLPPEEIDILRPSLGGGDWREELILKLSEEIKSLDLAEIAPGIGAEMSGDQLRLICFGREFFISPDGAITTEGGRMTPWIRILILHYIRTAGSAPLTGRWASYSELRAGMVKYSSFARECEEPLLGLFNADFQKSAAVLQSMGAAQAGGFPTRDAWVIYLLPKVPVALLYWQEEEEFPSRLKVLFDSTADQYLDVESIMFLVEGLVKNIQMRIS
ncbi:MAG: DUF3786 domain-containing protein [Nitrospirae bacterium]|nr:DUF3786 domain-containing protein [Nitrospirota bacterium]